MKKVLFTIVLMLLPMLASADAVEIKGIYYNLDNETKTAEVTENPDKYQGHVSIPDAINYNGRTYSVKSIGENAFAGCTDLTSIKIPNGVTSIGKNAFVLCSGLTSVIIPGSVTSIEKGAFECCTGLTSITIPNGVTSISEKVFDLCTGLTSVTIPGSVTTIGKGAFWNCTSLTSVTIPNSVTEIGVFAFRECTSLTSVTIPGSVTFIGEAAFSFCSSLTSVTIPNSVTTIESGLFCYCSNMTSVTIGSGVTDIGIYAFRACTSLKDVYCHAENVPTTESNAFDESNIANATLYVPTVSTDAYKAAEPWKGFKEIVALEDAVPVNIGGIYYKLNTKKKTAEVKENPDGYQGDIIIPDAVKYGGKKYSVTSIGKYAFSNSGLTSVTIGNKVTTIGEGAFCITGAMTSVTIGSSVKTIGYCAFAYSGLTSVTIPGSVTTIEEMAFDYCINMTSLTIGSGVTSIGKYAFGGCRSMMDVICHAENVPTTDSKAFDESNANAILHVPAVSTDAYSATEPWNGFKEIVALEDLNGDGVVDAKDIVALVRRIAEGDFSATGVLSDNGSAAGDINGDGVVNAADVVMLANIIMGK